MGVLQKIIRGRQVKGSKETRGGIKQHGERKIGVPGERRVDGRIIHCVPHL
jgi:hypothetical protein